MALVSALIPAVLLLLFLLFLGLFTASVRQDRRRFRNAVLLGLAVISGLYGLYTLGRYLPEPWNGVGHTLVAVVQGTAVLVLVGFLLANGLSMARKEGRRLANLLSGLVGLALPAVLLLMWSAASPTTPAAWTGATAYIVFTTSYVSFLFLCFLGYAFVYGRGIVREDVDHVVVLGCGLLDGDRVPPLLASRLRKGLEIHQAQLARGGPAPILLTSGGQGPDETVPEATAMARWLVAHGAPADHVREENRSRTTTENLVLSREIMTADRPDSRCVIVTNNFHAFRAAMFAAEAGVNGNVMGSPTAAYYWPSATIREFVAVFWQHRRANLAVCAFMIVPAVIVALTL
ncbi:YdcF family protein [Streptomyces sp. BI20]|uniref:YdcF family protein n=1 Tax=Streptomyces sp. BI20 TaxID=3403460 RepID=UPI003C75DC98